MAIKGEVNVSKQLEKVLDEYCEKVNEMMEYECKRIGYETAKDLKNTSPRSKRNHRHYADGWRASKSSKYGYIVHNSTHWQLTHLLNNGHTTPSGGRVQGDNHIGKAETKAVKKFIDEVEKKL